MEPLEPLPPSDEAPATVVPARSAWRANRLTSGIVAGGAALAMVLAGLGIANAQTDDTPTPKAPAASADNPRPHHGDREGCHPGMKVRLSVAATALGISEDELRTQLEAGKTIAAIAAEKGVDVNKVISALVDEAKAHLAQEVTDGKITQAQADERIATLTERITERVNNPRPAGDHDGPKGGPDGRRRGVKAGFSAAAKALGISEDELRTQLRAGKTIAEVAKDKGVDVNTVIAALVDEAKAHLAQEVKDGRITQAQADERIATLTERITEHVNNPRPPGDHRGPRRDDGDRPDPDGSPEAAPASFDA